MTIQNNEIVNYVTSLSAISGFILYNIRNQMGVNQREIAKIFDITHVTYGSMERGETAINSDFIYMLSAMVGIKFSDYFKLIEDIIIELENIKTDYLSNKAKINVIPSSEIQKLLSGKNSDDFSLAPTSDNPNNLLIGQDFNFFISSDLRAKLAILSQTRLTKEQIKEMINLKSSDLLEVQSELGMAAGAILITPQSFINTALGLTIATNVVGAVSLAGYELFRAYKKSKEDKKK